MASLDKQEEPFLFFFPSYDSDAHYKDISPSHWLHPFQRTLLSFFLFSAQHSKLPLPPSLSPLGFTFFFYFQPAFKLVRLPTFPSHGILIETDPKSCKFKRVA